MNSIRRGLLWAMLLLVAFVACTSAAPAVRLKVGATPVPHAEILEVVRPMLAAKGIDLEIIEFTDYVTPNLALNDGDIDANFFQHVPYLESFATDRRLNITYLAKVHIEPMGAYSRRYESADELPNRAKVESRTIRPTAAGHSCCCRNSGLMRSIPRRGYPPPCST